MNKIIVKSNSHNYPIYIGNNLLNRLNDYLTEEYSKIFVITDTNVAKLYLNQVLSSFKDHEPMIEIVPAGEKSKSIEVYYNIQTKALTEGLDRQSLIIALGGGVIGDLAGFVAATFMRGIDYIQVPTTILAHDSSVGGKVAINHELGKNLIGSFYAPKAVIYDLQTIQTLPKEEIRSGYAEIMKAALIARKHLFNELMQLDFLNLSSPDMHKHIFEAIQVKKEIVEKDERESFERMYLNLGHTLGHAIELGPMKGNILHGEAVAIGILFSLFVSERVYNIKLPIKQLYNWMNKNQYPLDLANLNVDLLIDQIKRDKKNKLDLITLILLNGINNVEIKSFSENNIRYYVTTFLESLIGGFND